MNPSGDGPIIHYLTDGWGWEMVSRTQGSPRPYISHTIRPTVSLVLSHASTVGGLGLPMHEAYLAFYWPQKRELEW
jgi:hypothetical protein